jgi:hypothetical protein
MTTYYVDPAASGSNNGSDWTNAWTSLQTAADTAVAGDIVYCRGTQTISARIDFDTNSGSNAAGPIKFIGCNASGVVDGTRFILNGNNYGGHICAFETTPADMLWFENIEVKNTGAGSYNGWHYPTSYADHHVYINCCANNCGSYGWYDRCGSAYFIRCVSYNNSYGFYGRYVNTYILCCARDNSTCGFYRCNGSYFFGCIAHGNYTGFDTGALGDRIIVFNSVIDGNTDTGILTTASTGLGYHLFLGCRITNQSGSGDVGLDCNSENIITGFNYFENNDGDNIQNATLHQFIPLEGGSSTSNIEDQSLTDQGYVDPTNHDFSTDYDSGAATQNPRRRAITVPWT